MARRPLYRDHAIVLRTWRLGEADRIVSVLGREHGKIRAVAKGVRKTRSRYGALLEPGGHIELQLYPGRELDTMTQAATVDHFAGVRGDLQRFSQAAVMLEAVEHVALDREPNLPLYQLLLGALRTLEAGDRPLLLTGFLLKLLALEGVQPALNHCVSCGATDDLCFFDARGGGAKCRSCRGGMPLSADGFGLMHLILEGRVGLALQEPPSRLTRDLQLLLTMAVEAHLNRQLRSAAFLVGMPSAR